MSSVDDYIYDGLGFPIKLEKVKLVAFAKELHPLIDVKEIADMAIKSLLTQKEKFTGGQIAFIRIYFSMTQKQLAKLVSEPLQLVQAWEKLPDKPVDMSINSKTLLKKHIRQELDKGSHLLATKGLFSAKQKPPKSSPDADIDNTPPKKKRKNN